MSVCERKYFKCGYVRESILSVGIREKVSSFLSVGMREKVFSVWVYTRKYSQSGYVRESILSVGM